MPPIVRTFSTAAEFLQALRRSHPDWLPENEWNSPWIFRGEKRSRQLLPSAFRPDIRKHPLFHAISQGAFGTEIAQKTDTQKAWLLQVEFEHRALMAFTGLVDDLGLPLMHHVPLPEPPNSATMYAEILHPMLAMAQHHGVPTRLLDWTLNPLVAAFFAAQQTRRKERGQNEHLVVWAAERNSLYPFVEFSAPRSHIGFLLAQEGVFTVHPDADDHFLSQGQWLALDDALPIGALHQLRLPRSEAPELRRQLHAERISRAHLMPTLDNVTHALQAQWNDIKAADFERLERFRAGMSAGIERMKAAGYEKLLEEFRARAKDTRE